MTGVDRRRVVVAVTVAVGVVLLGLSLATEPGDGAFYALTLAVAVVWTVGGLLSGPIPLGASDVRRTIATPVVIGLVASGVFVVGALIVREIGPLRDVVVDVLERARQGNRALVVVLTLATGAAEEVFFRGALFAALAGRRPVVVSTVLYVLVTIATGNAMLVFAAVLMGTLFALQRRSSGGVLAPMITHVVWSSVMILALPPLLGS